MSYRFNHDAYLRTLSPNAPLRMQVRAFCENCEAPIMPPAANHGLRFCPDCRNTPEYHELIASR